MHCPLLSKALPCPAPGRPTNPAQPAWPLLHLPTHPNPLDNHQVAIFLPERGNDNSGATDPSVVRAIVRDSSDVRTNGTLPFFLDSSGCVSGDPRCTEQPAVDLVGRGEVVGRGGGVGIGLGMGIGGRHGLE